MKHYAVTPARWNAPPYYPGVCWVYMYCDHNFTTKLHFTWKGQTYGPFESEADALGFLRVLTTFEEANKCKSE